MDFYNQPGPGTYMVKHLEPFNIPIKNSSRLIRVIAVSSNEASRWVVAYSILVALMFAAVTQLAINLVLAFAPLENSGNRRMMVVAFHNSPDPMSGAITIAQYKGKWEPSAQPRYLGDGPRLMAAPWYPHCEKSRRCGFV